MGTVVGILFVVLVLLWLFVKVTRTATVGAERLKHRDRCAFCRSRLKKTADRFGFASTCARCGKTQPWAAE